MNTPSTIICFILDKSGSMQSVKDETIDGFNSWLGDMQAKTPDALMTFTLFDTVVEVRQVAKPVGDVDMLVESSYVPDGGTALYDAIAQSIKQTRDQTLHMSPTPRTLCVISTDGGENSSKEWTADGIRSLVAEQEADNWEFVFLGAGLDSWHHGSTIGIRNTVSTGVTADAYAATYDHISRGTQSFAGGMSANVSLRGGSNKAGNVRLNDDGTLVEEEE